MTLRRNLTIQFLFMAVALGLWSWTAVRVFSQATPDPNVRDIRRVERQVDQIQQSGSELRIVMENRITKLEAQIDNLQAQNDKFQTVGIGLALTLFSLFLGTVWRMVSQEHKQKQRRDQRQDE